MPERRRLDRLRHDAGLLQQERAHLGGRPRRAAPEHHDHLPVAQPPGELVGPCDPVVEEPLDGPRRALGRGARAIDRRVDAVAGKEAREPRQLGHRRRERHRRGPGLRAGPGVEGDVAVLGERVGQPVGDRQHERSGPLLRDVARELHDLRALTGLADDRDQRVGAQDRPAEVQELRRVHQQGGDTPAGQVVHGRVAGVVRAPHPREHERAGRLGGLADPLQRLALVDERGGGAAEGVRLAGDLREEWVRKVS